MSLSAADGFYFGIGVVEGQSPGKFTSRAGGSAQSVVLLEASCVNSVICGNEGHVVLSGGNADDITEIVNKSRSVVLGVGGPAPSVGGLAPGEQVARGGEGASEDFGEHHPVAMVQLYQYQAGVVLDRDECINMDEAIKRSCSLLGDQIVEFFLGNNTVAVGVGSLDHFL